MSTLDLNNNYHNESSLKSNNDDSHSIDELFEERKEKEASLKGKHFDFKTSGKHGTEESDSKQVGSKEAGSGEIGKHLKSSELENEQLKVVNSLNENKVSCNRNTIPSESNRVEICKRSECFKSRLATLEGAAGMLMIVPEGGSEQRRRLTTRRQPTKRVLLKGIRLRGTCKGSTMKPLIIGLIVASVVLSLIVLAKETIDFTTSLDNEPQDATENLKSGLNPHDSDSVVVDVNNNNNKNEHHHSRSSKSQKKYHKVPRGYLNYQKKQAIIMSPTGQHNSDLKSDQVINIDKIKGLDLSAAVLASGHMHNQNRATNSETGSNGENSYSTTSSKDEVEIPHKSGQSKKQFISHTNGTFNYANVKCYKNRYDRIISQKKNMNDISRPVIEPDGKFSNPFPTWRPLSYFDMFRFMLFERDESNIPTNAVEVDKELPIVTPTFMDPLSLDSDFRVTWIGHSTLLIQVDGFNILTDPVFSERASPSQYFGPKRYRNPACDINSLPQIDIVLISHNHYDHLDSDSVRELNNRFGSQCRWLVPIGLGEFMESMSVENYVELNWWEKDCFHVGNTVSSNINSNGNGNGNGSSASTRAAKISRLEMSIYLTPTQHWSRRGVADIMRTLWGSYTIVNSQGSTFLFGGDSGYCSVFKEIGKIFGPFTGAALPIGAYNPRWFMKVAHVDPSEAIQIHRDIKSMKSIAIHHGTFALANEPYNEPKKLLKTLMDDLMANNTLREPFVAINHGESVDFCKNC